MSAPSQVVILDVGGQLFRTTRCTLTVVDGFFSRMLGSDWREGQSCDTSGETNAPASPPPKSQQQQHQQQQQPLTIFVDRDPLTFPAILSYLRSQRVFIPADADQVFLEKLQVEADYYALETLAACVGEELAKRAEKSSDQGGGDTMDAQDVFRCIGPNEVQQYFEQGWAFVSSFEANETASCSATGSKVTCTWRNNACSVCGFTMQYEKFVKHATFYRPTVIVVKRPKRGYRGGGAGGAAGFFPSAHGFTPFGLGGAGGAGAPVGLGLLGSPVPGGGGGGGGGGFIGAIPYAAYGAIDTDASFG